MTNKKPKKTGRKEIDPFQKQNRKGCSGVAGEGLKFVTDRLK